MAKRYAKYEDLVLVSGMWKPAGTLGRHHAVVTHQGDMAVVVGSIAGWVTLRSGDTLGYNCGEVWAVPKSDSFRDPLRRLLAERKIAQRVIERMPMTGQALETTERWYDQEHCPNGRPTHEWTTDGQKFITKEVVDHEPVGLFAGGGRRQITIKGATFAIQTDYGRHMNGNGYYRVTRIVVWPGCDQKKLLEAVHEAKHSS